MSIRKLDLSSFLKSLCHIHIDLHARLSGFFAYIQSEILSRLHLKAKAGSEVEFPFIPVKRSFPDRSGSNPCYKTAFCPEVPAFVFSRGAEHMTIFNDSVSHRLIPVLAHIITAKVERRTESREFRKRNVRFDFWRSRQVYYADGIRF